MDKEELSKTKKARAEYQPFEILGDGAIYTAVAYILLKKGMSGKEINTIKQKVTTNEYMTATAKRIGLRRLKYDQTKKRLANAYEYKVGKMLVEKGFEATAQYIKDTLLKGEDNGV